MNDPSILSRLLDASSDGPIPRDPGAMATIAGLAVATERFPSTTLLARLSRRGTGFHLALSTLEAADRDRSTIANAVARVALYGDAINDLVITTRYRAGSLRNAQNRVVASLAGELTMPFALVTAVPGVLAEDAGRLAEAFGVTAGVAIRRLADLDAAPPTAREWLVRFHRAGATGEASPRTSYRGPRIAPQSGPGVPSLGSS